MNFLKNKRQEKEKKYQRRKFKTNTKARLSLCGTRILANKTNLYMRAQVVSNDGNVIMTMNDKAFIGANKTLKAENLGIELASKLKEKGIEKVTFDRNGFLYHGRIKALADGLRKGGIAV